MVKNTPANAGDGRGLGSVPGMGRSPEEGVATTPVPCLENPMDRRAWQAAVYRAAKSRSQLSTSTYTLLKRDSRQHQLGSRALPRPVLVLAHGAGACSVTSVKSNSL